MNRVNRVLDDMVDKVMAENNDDVAEVEMTIEEEKNRADQLVLEGVTQDNDIEVLQGEVDDSAVQPEVVTGREENQRGDSHNVTAEKKMDQEDLLQLCQGRMEKILFTSLNFRPNPCFLYRQ